jgi:peptide/nickel transport system ATP-binding protein
MTTGASVLEIRDLTVQYRRGHRKPPLTAVRDACLTVAPGETVALAGESGSGKSTLGNAVLGLVPVTSGTIAFDGEDITRASPRRRRALTQDIQVIFQDPYGSLNPARAIGRALAEPLLAHQRLGRGAIAARVTAALERVGLAGDAAARYPDQFSGGQRQRIAIARALMPSPRLIICDEPLSALDLSVQAQVVNLLREIQRDLGVSYLFATHDLSVIPHIAHRLVVLYRGQVVETGPAAQVCAHPGHPYTQELVAAAPVPDPAQQRARQRTRGRAGTSLASPRSGCVFAPRCPHAITDCTAGKPAVFTSSGGGSVACSRYPELTGHLTGPLGDR